MTLQEMTLHHSTVHALHYVTSHHITLHDITLHTCTSCTDMYVGEIVQSVVMSPHVPPYFHLVDLGGRKRHVQQQQPLRPLRPRSLIDVPATFLDLAGVPLAPTMQGPGRGLELHG